MTISTAINAKVRRAKIVGFSFWLLFAVSIFVPSTGSVLFLSVIPFVGFAATILYIIFFIKCPRCSARLGPVTMQSGGIFSRKAKLNFCPNCGVDLNEPA